MASSGSKRGRSSESPMNEGARKRSQNQNLATEMKMEPERNNDEVQVKENHTSIMSLGLETKHPAERGSPPAFGEFLKSCGWCNKKIGHQSAYMFGNFNAFCKPQCQAKAVTLLYSAHLFESGLPEHPGIDAKKRSN